MLNMAVATTSKSNLNFMAPYTNTTPLSIMGSDAERIIAEMGEYNRAYEAERRDQERLFENIRMYWGVDYGQWDEIAVQTLLDENRHPITINLLSQKINTLAGALSATSFHVDYVPMQGGHSSLTKGFKDIYLSDKFYMGWDIADAQANKLGLIYRADQQPYIDRSKDPDGRIAWRTLPPGRVIYTPDWRSDNVKDCRKRFILHLMSTKQIAEKYGLNEDNLKLQVKLMRLVGQQFKNDPGVDLGRWPHDNDEGLKRVIEVGELVDVKTTRLVDPTKGYNGLAFPVAHPEKDRDFLKAWGDFNNVNWEYVRETTYKDKILKIFTICPDISITKPLEDKPSEIQIGMIDTIPWAADRLNGKWRGIVDIAKDCQTTLNKTQSQKQHMINSAANGATLFNSELTGGDAGKLEHIKRNKNNPSYVNDVDLDNVEKTHIVMKDQPYDSALFQNETLMIDIMDLVTPVPAAMSSRTESSRESGVLYQTKVAIAEVGMKTLNDSFRNHILNKAAAYFELAQIFYRKKHRNFPRANGEGFVSVNLRTNVDGRPVMINDISAIPQCYVIVKEDQNGLITRHMNRLQYAEMMKNMPQEISLLRTWLALQAAKTVDMSEKDQVVLDTITNMEFMKAVMAYKTEMMNMAANQKQAQAMIVQLEQQIMMMAQQMGGMPQEEVPLQVTNIDDQPAPMDADTSNLIPFKRASEQFPELTAGQAQQTA